MARLEHYFKGQYESLAEFGQRINQAEIDKANLGRPKTIAERVESDKLRLAAFLLAMKMNLMNGCTLPIRTRWPINRSDLEAIIEWCDDAVGKENYAYWLHDCVVYIYFNNPYSATLCKLSVQL